MTQANNVAIESSQINSSGVLTVPGGGTGGISFPSGAILFGAGASALGGTSNFTYSSNTLALSDGTTATAKITSGGGIVTWLSQGASSGTSSAIYNATQHIWQYGGTEGMRLSTSGYLGIGLVPTGAAQLEINSTSTQLNLTDQTSTGNGNKTVILSALKNGVGYHNLQYTAYQHIWQAGGSAAEAMRIDSGGNVGIGTTSIASGAKLDVNGRIFTVNGTAAAPSITSRNENNAGLFFGDDGVGSYLGFSAAGSEGMRLDRSGNLLIGTSASTYNYQVKNIVLSDAGSTGLQVVGAGTVAEIVANSSAVYMGSRNSFPTVFVTNDTERMRITSAGNIGMGTTSPTSKLQVSSGAAPVIYNTGTVRYTMLGKVVQSNSNASATTLFSINLGTNNGFMIKVVIFGTSAITNQMWEDVGYAWWWGTGGGYSGSGATTSTVTNVQGSHTVGTLSWLNPSSRTPSLQYTQGNNGYILESLDVYVTTRDGSTVTFVPDYVAFG